jgi:hypothetical protein
MNETINFPAAVVFILKNMYFNECEFFQENDAEGNPMKNEEGKLLKSAKHPEGLTFKEWLELHQLVLKSSGIITDKMPLQIIKP